MRFDDGMANSETHAHAVGLGREEGVENPVSIGRVDPGARIPHRYHHQAGAILARANHQLTRPVVHRGHCLDPVDDQVDDHLLKLNSIAEDGGQTTRKLRAKHHPLCRQFTLKQRGAIADDGIQIESDRFRYALFGERPDMPDDLGRTLPSPIIRFRHPRTSSRFGGL
jgi:hypothetical protein